VAGAPRGIAACAPMMPICVPTFRLIGPSGSTSNWMKESSGQFEKRIPKLHWLTLPPGRPWLSEFGLTEERGIEKIFLAEKLGQKVDKRLVHVFDNTIVLGVNMERDVGK